MKKLIEKTQNKVLGNLTIVEKKEITPRYVQLILSVAQTVIPESLTSGMKVKLRPAKTEEGKMEKRHLKHPAHKNEVVFMVSEYNAEANTITVDVLSATQENLLFQAILSESTRELKMKVKPEVEHLRMKHAFKHAHKGHHAHHHGLHHERDKRTCEGRKHKKLAKALHKHSMHKLNHMVFAQSAY